MDWKMLSAEKPRRLGVRLLFVLTLIFGFLTAKGQVYESTQKGYTIESIGTYTLNALQTALDQGDWDTYRKVSQPVVLTFDDGTKVRLHAANTRPQPNLQLALPDETAIVDRTFSLTPSGHLLVIANNPYKH